MCAPTGVSDYLSGKCARLQSLKSNSGEPQGSVFSPFLFTLNTTDERYGSDSCHIQKFLFMTEYSMSPDRKTDRPTTLLSSLKCRSSSSELCGLLCYFVCCIMQKQPTEGCRLLVVSVDSFRSVMERRVLRKLPSTLGNIIYPLRFVFGGTQKHTEQKT